MADTFTITRDGLTVEHGAAQWGGPTAKATVTAGPLTGRCYWLRSTQGLDNDLANDLKRGGGIFIDSSDPEVSHDGCMGVVKTYDMEEALDALVKLVNGTAARLRVQDATWGETAAVGEAWSQFTDSLNGERRNWRVEWRRMLEAVVALDMKIREADRG